MLVPDLSVFDTLILKIRSLSEDILVELLDSKTLLYKLKCHWEIRVIWPHIRHSGGNGL